MTKIFAIIAAMVLCVSISAAADMAKPELLFADKLEKTEGIAVCPGKGLFVAEQGGKVHRIFEKDGTPRTEVFAEGLSFPAGMACGSDGSLYALEYKDGNVVLVGGKDNRKVASGMTTLNAAAVRSDGTVFVSETDPGKVTAVNPKDGSKETAASGITFANGLLFSKDESILYAASTTTGKIFMIALSGENKGKKKTFKDKLQMIDGITSDSEGNIYACLYGTGKVARIDSTGNVEIIAEGMTSPASPAVYEGWLYVTSLNGKGVYRIKLPENEKQREGAE